MSLQMPVSLFLSSYIYKKGIKDEKKNLEKDYISRKKDEKNHFIKIKHKRDINRN